MSDVKKTTQSSDASDSASQKSQGAIVSSRPAPTHDADQAHRQLHAYSSADGELEKSSSVGVDEDDKELAARMGVKSEFAREFKSLSTISFAFSIMGLISSVATTFNTPFIYGGGPASTIWAWAMGSIFNLSLGAAIGNIISAYPSSGGLYSASGLLVPRKYRAVTAWCTGWLNYTGQIAGIAGTAYGLAQMLWAYAYVATGYVPGSGTTLTGAYVGLYCAIMIVHGVIASLDNKVLARMTSGYVFINLGITIVTSIVVLARTPPDEMKTGAYAFGELLNPTGYASPAYAFLVGLGSVQFVMTDYDATGHMSEDIHRASFAAPVAIFIAVAGTGLFGFLLNTAMVFASGDVITGDVTVYPGGLAFAQILLNRAGRVGFLIIWPFIMSVAWFVVTTALQANARSFYAFSRDGGLPDNKFFARINKRTGQTVNAVWLVVILCIALVMLAFASQYAIIAIFSLAALGMDLSYLIPIVSLQFFHDHPDVQYKPGPFNLGFGLFGTFVNWTAIIWTLFECTILSMPATMPYTAQTFNWSWVIAFGVLFLAAIWYFVYAHKTYEGPRSTLNSEQLRQLGIVSRADEVEAEKVSHH